MSNVFRAVAARRDSVRSEDGATAVEYALMIALLAVVISASVSLLGTRLAGGFDDVRDGISGVESGSNGANNNGQGAGCGGGVGGGQAGGCGQN